MVNKNKNTIFLSSYIVFIFIGIYSFLLKYMFIVVDIEKKSDLDFPTHRIALYFDSLIKCKTKINCQPVALI